MAWHPAEADTRAFVSQCPKEVHDITNEGIFHIFTINHQQARHRIRLEYNIMHYRIHVPIIVQSQGNGCSLSSIDDAVIRESFRHLAVRRLTILWMVVDDRWCPHPLVNLWSVSVDHTVWSLIIVILSEFSSSLFSSDHAFTPPPMRFCFVGSYSCVIKIALWVSVVILG